MKSIKIAILEDESAIRRLLEINLQAEGFQTFAYETAIAFLNDLPNNLPDLLLLDIMLPEMDGIELCRKLRQNPQTRLLPIIMLTAKGEEIDRVVGLEVGADDYVTKPFSVRELIARIRALLRRSAGQTNNSSHEKSQNKSTLASPLKWHRLSLDLKSHQAYCDEKPLALSSKEFAILHALMVHPGWVATRESLLEDIWGFDYEGETRTVDMHIANLRRKIEKTGGKGSWIETIRGVGYRLLIGEDVS